MSAPMGNASELRQTPLNAVHRASGARLVDFAGWEMPVFYTGILDESRAVRTSVGLFDVSHMGRIWIAGKDAVAYLQRLTSNDVEALKPSEAQYSLLMNPSGGIIDDIIVYRETDSSFMVVINAGNAAKDIAWMRSHIADGSGSDLSEVTLEDRSEQTAMIAVQGPLAPELVAKITDNPELLELGRFQYAKGAIAGAEAIFCRTGYTGEDGFELIVPAENAVATWTLLVEGGAVACGLGARDALRIEAGYPLYGHEIDDTTTPVEAGLMWATSLEKSDFIGKAHVVEVKRSGPKRKLMGLVLKDRIIPRQGYTIYASDGVEIGSITSGIFSPTLNHSIALGYVSGSYAKRGGAVLIGIRDKQIPATIVPKKSLLTLSE